MFYAFTCRYLKQLACALLLLLATSLLTACFVREIFVRPLVQPADKFDTIEAVAFSPDSQLLASVSSIGVIKLWDLSTSTLHTTFTDPDTTYRTEIGIDWSPDGKFLVVGSHDGSIHIWDIVNNKLYMTIHGHQGTVRTVAFRPGGKQFVTGSAYGGIKLWDAVNGHMLIQLRKDVCSCGLAINEVAWNPNGQLIAIGDSGGAITIGDVAVESSFYRLKEHESNVWSVAWSPDGAKLASVSNDQTMKLWDMQQRIVTATIHEPGTHVRWNPDGTTVANTGDSGMLKFVDVANGNSVWSLYAHDNAQAVLTWSPDGQTFATGSERCDLKLWKSGSASLITILQGEC
jgi:WD40 repeat protein